MSKNKIIYIGSQATAVQGKENADVLGKKTTLITETTSTETSNHCQNHCPKDFLNDEGPDAGNTNVENTLYKLNCKHT